MKILVATEKPFAPVAVEGIRKIVEESGNELALLERGSRANLLAAVADVEALIVRSDIIDRDVLDAAPKLRIVVRAGAGVDNIDLAYAREKAVVVMNTPGQNANAVAELVFGMLVSMARNRFDGTSGFELKGKRLGLQAYGQVGRNVARIAKGFGMEVSAYDPYLDDAVLTAEGVTPVHDLHELYSNNRFVSLHIPATPDTRGSIGRDLVALMPKGGILINTARKEIIDEASLLDILAERTDLMYIADVKPDREADFLALDAKRVMFTPKKMGAQTAEANINAGLAAARQIVDYFTTGNERFRVNR